VAEEHRSPLTYLARNRALVEALVDSEDVLVACPNEPTAPRRSGTWSTVRYASGLGKRVLLVLPRGLVVPAKGGRA
jgi:predicted Rossmann fold nucleotide-binding protein DprA/Smf involved in DNA uptake